MSDPIQEFRAEIAAAGLIPPDTINGDGKLHRGSGKAGSFWYVLHLDGIAAGVFGCWRLGTTQTWCSKADDAMTMMEREAHRQRIKAMQAQREADEAARHGAAAAEAAQQWQDGTACTEHPYLTTKGVQGHGVRSDGVGGLLVPMRDTAGNLHSLQTITQDGDKRFLFGGRVKGCYHAIGKPKGGALIVCEGYATGATLHEATGQAVAVAFNAGNLAAVALALRAKYPALKITVAADDDHKTEGNPGTTKATAAALAVGGCVAVPVFPAGRPDKATDFNDLYKLAGLEAVRACIDAAQPTTEPGSAWPDPMPLPDALPPVQAFDADLLPAALRAWVVDIAHRMQCPADFPAVTALVAISSLIGARAVVQPKARDDWQVVPNLWGMAVGTAGR